MNYFTSDFHIGSSNIIKYAHRPFKDAEEMMKHYYSICFRVPMSDRIIHVGDFCLSGKDSHDGTTDEGLKKAEARDFIANIPHIVLLNGNHDSGHNFPANAHCMIVSLGHHYKRVSVGHYPSTDAKNYEGLYGSIASKFPQIHLCGHVHAAWLLKWDPMNNVLNVNVGPDGWYQKLVSEDELVNFLDYFFKYLFTELKKDDIRGFAWTRSDYDFVRNSNDKALREGAAERHAEKLAKKGITPEEAERRKIEAMKKKGLLK